MIFGVLFVMSIGCGPALAGNCPLDWAPFESKCYHALNKFLSLADGRTACKKLEAYLAVAGSISENTFIWEAFMVTFDQDPKFGLWAGYTRQDGNWQPYQSDGDLYYNWANGQPATNNGNCAAMSVGSGGKWGAQSCANTRGVVCERPPIISSAPRQVFCFHTQGNGRLTTHGCLKHHAVRELRVGGVVSCGRACRAEHRCRSFNLLERDDGKMVCQLNNATRYEEPEEAMEDSKNCYHFDL